MSERRVNQPVRTQAQQWFEALRTHLTSAGIANDVTERMQAWNSWQDVLGDRPQLVPHLFTMAWQLRHQPAFTDLFLTASGEIAEDTATTLKVSGKSFNQVVLGQLQGAMRVYCEGQEKAWLKAERVRRPPPAITTWPIIGPLMARLLRQRDRDILRRYPQHGLYLTLKPWLLYPTQFALIEALATLPTSTVRIFGDAVRGLTVDASIRNLAALETRKCKFITDLARLFAETLIAQAESARAAGTQAATEGPTRADMAVVTGMSLTQLATDGLHLAQGAVAMQEKARNIVTKMTSSMGYNVWNAFATKEAATNVLLCPPGLAKALGNNAVLVHQRTSDALMPIQDQRIVEGAIAGLSQAAGADAVARWVANPKCATGWLRIANEVKQTISRHGEGSITFESAATFCQGLASGFAYLAGEAADPAAAADAPPPAEPPPSEQASAAPAS